MGTKGSKWRKFVDELSEKEARLLEEQPDKPSRRQQPRVPISLKVEIRLAGGDEILANKTLDLSTTGVFIRTRDVRAIGTPVRLRLNFRTRNTIIEGVIKHRVPVDDEKGNLPGIGVEFTDISDEAAEFIERVLEEHRHALR